MNKSMLEKVLVEAAQIALLEMQDDIYKWIETEVFPMIEANAYDIADDVLSLGSTTVHKVNRNNDKSHWAYKLGAALGKAIVNAFDDIMAGKRKIR